MDGSFLIFAIMDDRFNYSRPWMAAFWSSRSWMIALTTRGHGWPLF